MSASYRFGMAEISPGEPAEPALTIRLAFAPGVAAPDADGLRAALAQYEVIAGQLAESGIELSLGTTVLAAEAAQVAGTDALRPALADFVAAVLAELRADDGAPGPVVRDLAFAVNAPAVATRTDDLFAVGVRLTLSRGAAELVSLDVLAARADAAGWARDFEQAFAGFDGADGRLRVLSQADGSLWALRCSRAAGVWVDFPPDEPAYFTFAPLSTALVSGQAPVVEYDPATLKPQRERTVSFASVELDAWGESFLAALDDMLAPEMSAAIARLDEAAFAELTRCRATMARVLCQRLVPVYTDESAGDLDAAREAFERSLLGSLSSAYTVSAVVQLPASVQMAGEGERPSRCVGRVAAPGEIEAGYAAGAATVRLLARPWLTFLVSASEPWRASILPLEGSLEVREVDAGSRGLALVLTEETALQPLHVPVPLRGFPTVMTGRQMASGASAPASEAEDSVRGALEWDYTVEVATPGNGAQDELWAEVAYNLPADSARPAAPSHEPEPSPTGLFAALAAFETAWPELLPLLPRIPAAAAGAEKPAHDGPSAHAVIAAATALVGFVTERWASQADTPGLGEVPPPAAPAPASDEFVIGFQRAGSGQLAVYARAGSGSGFDPARAEQWPSIGGELPGAEPVALAAGQGPDAAGGWYGCGYTYLPAPLLTLRWSSLDLVSRQTARSTFRVVRNARLAAGAPRRTNDALVYRTAPVGFATPLLPLIEVERVGPLPACSTLSEALAQVLQPVSEVGTAVVGERVMELGISYDYPLATEAAEVMVSDVILRAHRTPIGPAEEPIAALAAALARQVTNWHEITGRPTAGATLCLRVLLFVDGGGAHRPLVQLGRVEIAVPPGWWAG